MSLNTLLGGRIICGAASASGAIVFSYITSIAQDRGIVFKLLSIYRAAAGIFMALAQLIVIFFGYCDFKIKGYRIASYNAPTFASSFIILAVCLLLVVVLENPEVKVTNSENSLFSALKQFFRVERKKTHLLLDFTMEHVPIVIYYERSSLFYATIPDAPR